MPDPKLPAVMYGDLTARQHAIKEAMRWQRANVRGEQRKTYVVIRDLLAQFDFDDIEAARTALDREK